METDEQTGSHPWQPSTVIETSGEVLAQYEYAAAVGGKLEISTALDAEVRSMIDGRHVWQG